MKKTAILMMAVAIMAVMTCRAQIRNFTWQNTQRQYLLFEPSGHDGALPVMYPEAIKMMNEMAAAFADDYITQKLIQKWIEGEQDHMAWEAQYLNYIKKLGYENFLTAMM